MIIPLLENIHVWILWPHFGDFALCGEDGDYVKFILALLAPSMCLTHILGYYWEFVEWDADNIVLTQREDFY